MRIRRASSPLKMASIFWGWAAYYRTGVSKKTFVHLDTHMWKLAFSWAKRSHPNKPNRWVVDRHFGAFRRSRNDRWVFGDRDSGAYLAKFAWTPIVRHQVVKGPASPDDPALAEYWAERRRRRKPPLDKARLRLIQAQHGRCPLCRGLLLHADHEPQTPQEWEQWVKVTRTAIHTRPLRAAAQQRPRARTRPFCPPVSLWACLSRDARKAGLSGSEGAGAQQCAPATRPHPGRCSSVRNVGTPAGSGPAGPVG